MASDRARARAVERATQHAGLEQAEHGDVDGEVDEPHRDEREQRRPSERASVATPRVASHATAAAAANGASAAPTRRTGTPATRPRRDGDTAQQATMFASSAHATVVTSPSAAAASTVTASGISEGIETRPKMSARPSELSRYPAVVCSGRSIPHTPSTASGPAIGSQFGPTSASANGTAPALSGTPTGRSPAR